MSKNIIFTKREKKKEKETCAELIDKDNLNA